MRTKLLSLGEGYKGLKVIGIYDKGNRGTTFIQNVREYAKLKAKVCADLHELRDCEIAIAHIYGKEWNSLIENSFPGYVRVRVTVGGNFSDKPPPTVENGVYIFHLVMRAGDLESEWKEILYGLSEKKVVESLIRGENPNGLRSFFVHEGQEHLSALTMFCEGYLVVHAGHEDYYTDIRYALDLMGWTELRGSTRGQGSIYQNLSKRKDEVQQLEWWLNMFGQAGLYKDVQQEWKATAKAKVPEALNKLLKTIRNNEATVPAKIVADAYCVLAKKGRVTSNFQWQARRNKFNHDWLKNKFLNSLDDFIVELGESGPDIIRLSEFLERDFAAWESRQQDAQWIVQSFEDSMSPQRFMESAPLNRCDAETQTWLGKLVHELWLSRYPVKSKVQESRDALAAVNKIYEKIAFELEQAKPIELTKLIALHSQFCELKETYQVLSKTLSALSQEV